MNYRAMPGGRILSRVSVLVFSLAAVAWIVVAASAPHQRAFPWWIAAIWLVAAGWNIYWLGLRVCNEVRVEGSTLTWWTAYAAGRRSWATSRSCGPSGSGDGWPFYSCAAARPYASRSATGSSR